MEVYQRLRGTKDYFPPQSEIFREVESRIVNIIKLFGFREIINPTLERKELFTRSVGESTDIVEKEMFTFVDKGGREVVLRPEGTAPVVRAYVEEKIYKKESVSRFFYRGAFFRYERPQAGREREFHQIGVEVLGYAHPFIDAEIIILGDLILKSLGLQNYSLELGSVGCFKDREKFRNFIRKELAQIQEELCADCQRRVVKNPLRIFDCKVEKCKKIASKLPSLLDALCERCGKHFETVSEILNSMGVKHHQHPHLVRGIDYYTSITFEFQHKSLGAQNTLLAGGRYDQLVEEMGGPSIPACGFALGMERILLALEEEGKLPEVKDGIEVFVCYISEKELPYAFSLLTALRKEGISGEMDYKRKSIKSQLKRADKRKAKLSLILGEEEVKKGEVTVRDMRSGEQFAVKKDEVVNFLRERLKK